MSFVCLHVRSVMVFKILRILFGKNKIGIAGHVSQMATDFLQPIS